MKKTTILTIEDEKVFRETVAAYFEYSGYMVIQAGSGKEGLDILQKEVPDVVLLDLRMPDMHGLELLEKLTDNYNNLPIIIVSGTGDVKEAIESLKLGAWDFVMKPIQDMMVLEHAVEKCVERARLIDEHNNYHARLEEEIHTHTAELEKRTAELTEVNELLKEEVRERIFAEDALHSSLEQLERSIEGTISTISFMAEMRDPYTGGHQQRVAHLARALAEELDYPDEQVQGIYIAAMVHDIGKIAVPIEILFKPGRLTDLDMQYIRMHPAAGYDILKMIEFRWPVAEIVLQHHERIDGSGYPEGLEGKYILSEAKILGVADVVESIATNRPYRGALGMDLAINEISANAGVLYDERVVEACVRVIQEKDFHFDMSSRAIFIDKLKTRK
ncbi:MAG: HD domain-containing phosphohydrolase [Spirochaetota bacterium]